MNFRELDALVNAHQSVTTKVFVAGELVHENLSARADRPWRVYSITKSVVSLLAGIAEAEGLLSLEDPVARFVPEWHESPSNEVSIRELLSMTSGRRSTVSLEDEMMSIALDQSEFALGVGQDVVPSASWLYDNIAAQVLEPVLTAATGDLIEFAQQKLFTPLSFDAVSWQRDEVGNPLTYTGLTATADQLGAIGQLMINRGVYGGRQLVPADYVQTVTSSSSELNSAYGLLWWINASGKVLDGGVAVGAQTEEGARGTRLAPSIPEDALWALGWGSQLMAVVPSQELVAIRFGRRPRYPETFTLEAFTAAALAGID